MTTETDGAGVTGSGRRVAGDTREAAGSSRTSSAVIKRQLVFNGLLTRGTSAEISAAADDSRIVGKFAAASARVAADLWSNVKQATSSLLQIRRARQLCPQRIYCRFRQAG